MAELMRLNKYLASCGLGSRRSCDELINSGKVLVNGNPPEMGVKVDPEVDEILFEGEMVVPQKGKEYWLYHKPRGVVVSMKDPHNPVTIYDDLDKKCFDARHLKYVGRLDKESEGALILTNDGDLVHAITHPKYHIKKLYKVLTDIRLSDDEIHRMVEEGIESEGVVLHAGSVRFLEEEGGNFWYEVILYEGKNRQIRRLFDGIGKPVRRLKREQFANVKLRELPYGSFRELQEREVQGMKSKGYKINKKRGTSR